MAKLDKLELNGWFRRSTFVIDENSVIELDGQFSQDRVRRLVFERIRSISYRRSRAYVGLFFILLFIAAISLALIFDNPFEIKVMASGGIAALVVVFIVRLWYFRYTIQIDTNVGQSLEASGVIWQSTFNTFLNSLTEQIRAYQSSVRASKQAE